ncbi:hypothetical protein [Klebsiella phage phiKp_21]|nr:hypothetical protein [Klebsiella phage phiKp_21]
MKEIIANDKIIAKTVRLVMDGSSEVMAIAKARQEADNLGLDIVVVNNGDVPVVKIVDLNKYKYELKQSEKASLKKQRQNVISTKEIQFTFGTQDNDLTVKAKSATKFLSEGKNVLIVMKTVGRGNTPQLVKQNIDAMNAFVKRLGEVDFIQKVEYQGKKVTCTVKSTVK